MDWDVQHYYTKPCFSPEVQIFKQLFADLFACLLLLVQDTKISSLERNIRDLEDEVQMLKTSGLLHPDERQEELKQVEVYKSHSKFMKTKVEYLCMQPSQHQAAWSV